MLPSKIEKNESIDIRFYNNINSICERNNSTLNSSITYNLYKNLKPYKAEYISMDDINNQIKFLNNTILGKDYNNCKLQNETIIPKIGSDRIEGLDNALKYCTVFKQMCIGITSIDKNNIYWKLISNINSDSDNFDLIKSDTNTYVSDKYNYQTENFNSQNYSKIISDSTILVYTDNFGIIIVIGIIIILIIIYIIYYRRKLIKN